MDALTSVSQHCEERPRGDVCVGRCFRLYMIHRVRFSHLVHHYLMFPSRMLILQFKRVFVDFVFATTMTWARNINQVGPKVFLTLKSDKHHIMRRKVTFDRSNV